MARTLDEERERTLDRAVRPCRVRLTTVEADGQERGVDQDDPQERDTAQFVRERLAHAPSRRGRVPRVHQGQRMMPGR